MESFILNIFLAITFFLSLYVPFFTNNINNVKGAGFQVSLENLFKSSRYDIKNSSVVDAVYVESFFSMNGDLITTVDGSLQPNQTITSNLVDIISLSSDWNGYVIVSSDQEIEVTKQDTLLYDGFFGQTLTESPWFFTTSSDGTYQFDDTNMSNPFLNINIGTSLNSSSTLSSIDTFRIDSQLIKADTRIKLDNNSSYFWGMQGINENGVVGFRLSSTGELQAIVRESNLVPETVFNLSGINVLEWHTYRIETSPFYAKFYIDGTLKTTIETNLPFSKDLNFLVINTSQGISKMISIDFVDLLVYSNVYAISGTVLTDAGLPAANIAMQITPFENTFSTDNAGNYQFTNLFPGSYTINALDSGLNLQPLYQTISIINESIENVDFTLTLPPEDEFFIYLPMLIR
ncbi:MAG: hypothetical protein CL609_00965 [Anaerolineaceae bacterium]|nr:hypothetical protein [Anaerolineaceae bacterium]